MYFVISSRVPPSKPPLLSSAASEGYKRQVRAGVDAHQRGGRDMSFLENIKTLGAAVDGRGAVFHRLRSVAALRVQAVIDAVNGQGGEAGAGLIPGSFLLFVSPK